MTLTLRLSFRKPSTLVRICWAWPTSPCKSFHSCIVYRVLLLILMKGRAGAKSIVLYYLLHFISSKCITNHNRWSTCSWCQHCTNSWRANRIWGVQFIATNYGTFHMTITIRQDRDQLLNICWIGGKCLSLITSIHHFFNLNESLQYIIANKQVIRIDWTEILNRMIMHKGSRHSQDSNMCQSVDHSLDPGV